MQILVGVFMNEPTCVKCDQPAVYEAPDILCDQHWLDWWNEGLPEKERIKRLPRDEGCRIAYDRMDTHIGGCDTCQDLLYSHGEYCPIGLSLEEDWSETIPEDCQNDSPDLP